ncbi:MAG: histidinol dehydrogenase [Planctomycetota bacterium]|jgi:histidinol dehydrogenase|nr:histidinol dehydrogenase [Planctomycetota bacterium]
MIPVRPLAEYQIDHSVVVDPDTISSARSLVEAVRSGGDSALRKMTLEFDGVDLDSLEVPREVIESSQKRVPSEVKTAIRSAYENILSYHSKGVLEAFEFESQSGVTVGRKVVPFRRAGLYAPGGLAVYPSMVLMAAGPAQVAGVEERVLCSPPTKEGVLPDSVLYAALIAGIDRVFLLGGAHAIAAMAYGTESVPPCEILAGPGNRFVTAAKKIVSEDVAIDFLAGPSEVLVLADGTTSSRLIAAEMIAQAEHAPDACSLLVTSSSKQAEEVGQELSEQIESRERMEVIGAALEEHGALLVADSLQDSIDFSNRYAPEHLVLSVRDPESVLTQIQNAGSVFLGEYSPVAIGDYCYGPNSILPTLGLSRRLGGLTANSFLKTVSWQKLSPQGLASLAEVALPIARVENLEGHAASIEMRDES